MNDTFVRNLREHHNESEIEEDDVGTFLTCEGAPTFGFFFHLLVKNMSSYCV